MAAKIYAYRHEKLAALGIEPSENGLPPVVAVTALTRRFFEIQNNNSNSNFDGSVIYLNGCYSAAFYDAFSTAKLFLGTTEFTEPRWGTSIPYYFFHYIMYGGIIPEEAPGCPSSVPPLNDKPMHVREAFDTLHKCGVSSPCPVMFYDYNRNGQGYRPNLIILPENSTDEVYFPGKAHVTIEKNGKNIK